jgi:putative phage-type endonuclease
MQAVQLSTAPQGTLEWLNARKTGIGSTDSAVILGVNEYKTPIELWKEKRGELSSIEDNWYMRRGRALEPVLRQEYSDRMNKDVLNMDGVLCHPRYRFLLASLDGFTKDDRLVECKTASSAKGWGAEGTDELPAAYLVQVQHAMLVTGFKVTDVVVSIAGGQPRFYEVRADDEFQDLILAKGREFMNRVEQGIEPEPKTLEERLAISPIKDGSAVYATSEVLDQFNDLLAMRKTKKDAETDAERIAEIIKGFLIESGASILLDQHGNQIATWNEGKGRTSYDTKRMELEIPEIAAKYKTIGKSFRTFRVNGE